MPVRWGQLCQVTSQLCVLSFEQSVFNEAAVSISTGCIQVGNMEYKNGVVIKETTKSRKKPA